MILVHENNYKRQKKLNSLHLSLKEKMIELKVRELF